MKTPFCAKCGHAVPAVSRGYSPDRPTTRRFTVWCHGEVEVVDLPMDAMAPGAEIEMGVAFAPAAGNRLAAE